MLVKDGIPGWHGLGRVLGSGLMQVRANLPGGAGQKSQVLDFGHIR